MTRPLIVYVPGLLAKPEPQQHRAALAACMHAGLRRVDMPVADAVARVASAFQVVPWTYDFYGVHSDIAEDKTAIDALVKQSAANATDIAEARSWRRRLTRWIYRLGDRLPFLIPHLAGERMEVHLRDLRRYVRNKNGVADRVRSRLKVLLLEAAGSERPILLIGHSMGSIIAYDALWELSHQHGNPVTIDLLLTMGSPLGQHFIQARIKGHDRDGSSRYPCNIRYWKNLAAAGDLTAIDPWLANDFAEMTEIGPLRDIDDEELFNFYRLNGVLNVHSEYGYFANEKTARTIANWWRSYD